MTSQYRILIIILAALCLRLLLTSQETEAPFAFPEQIPGCLDLESSGNEPFLPNPDLAQSKAFLVNQKGFLVSIMTGKQSGKQVHDPLYCAQGKGWQVLEKGMERIPGGEARRLVIEKDGRYLHLLYWFDHGQGPTASFFRFKIMTALQRLIPFRPGERSFVLVQSIHGDRRSWQALETDLLPWLQ